MTQDELKVMLGQHGRELFETIENKFKDKFLQLDPTVQSKIDKLNDKVSDLEAARYRPNLDGKSVDLDEVTAKRFELLQKHLRGNSFTDAEADFIRKNPAKVATKQKFGGIELKTASGQLVETKKMIEGDFTLGGALVFPEYVQEITKGIVLYSPFRELAKTRTTSTNEVIIPKRTRTASASWTGEIATRSETQNPTYGQNKVPVHELVAVADISRWDIEDSAFDLPGEIQNEFSEQFAKGEGAAFINGTGVAQPYGFMTELQLSAYSAQIDVTGSASALTYAGYVLTAHKLPTFYARNATWLMNRLTMGSTRQIVDGQSRPIWMPYAVSGMDAANPGTILNMPYREMPDMPDVGASTYPVALGDWKKAYLIVDRINMEMTFDPYTQLNVGCWRYYGRKRVGGQPILIEAMRLLQCHV